MRKSTLILFCLAVIGSAPSVGASSQARQINDAPETVDRSWSAYTRARDVEDLVVDRFSGALWAATYAGGLVRWDLETWEHAKYKTPDGLPDHWVTSLDLDPATGTLWIGTWDGVARLDPGGQPVQIDTDGVGVVIQTHDIAFHAASGNVWVAVPYGPIRIAPDGTVQRFTKEDGVVSDLVLALAVDPHTDDVWFGTDKGASRLSVDGRWLTHALPEGCPNGRVSVITIDRVSGDRWFAVVTESSPSGPTSVVCRESPDGTLVVLEALAGEAISSVLDIEPHPETGDVWIARYGRRPVVRIGPDGSEVHVPMLGTSNRIIQAIAADLRTTDLFFGGSDFTARLAIDGTWHEYSTRDSEAIRGNHITNVVVDPRNGDVWCTPWDGDVVRIRYDGAATTVVPDLRVNDLDLEARTGAWWLATSSGAFRLDPSGALERFATEDGLPGDIVATVAVDQRAGDVWLGTSYGLARRDSGGTWHAYDRSDHELASQTAKAIASDSHTGDVWFGFEHGLLIRSADGSWSAHPSFTSYPASDVRSIVHDPATGEHWVGTADGAFRIDPHGWVRHYSVGNGLPSRLVDHIAIDPVQGGAWLATYRDGVTHIAADGSVATFTKQDGLAADLVERVAVDPIRGAVWFGTLRGVGRLGPPFPSASSYLPLTFRPSTDSF